MPLIPMEPPESVRTLAAAHVYRAAIQPGASVLGDVDSENLHLVAPHRVYSLGLDALVQSGLSGAEPAGWRFLVADGDRVVASAELAEETDAPPLVNAGPYVGATVEAIGAIEQRSLLDDGDFELRLLKVPALYVVAAWLIDERRIVLPLAPTPSFLEPGTPYPEEQFAALLAQPAQRIREMHDETSGG